MNIEQLKQRLAAQVTEVDGWRLCKVNAVDGLEFSRRFASIPADAPAAQTVEAYAYLLSKCVVDESGERNLDTDEGRGLLVKLDYGTLAKIGEAAITWNLGAKKN